MRSQAIDALDDITMASPRFLEEEHAELMGSLRSASKLGDETGKAVGRLLEKLEPHFEEEERLVTPCLGALADLAEGVDATVHSLAQLSPQLKERYRTFYKEHETIKERAVIAGGIAAKEMHSGIADTIEALVHHAMVEEEVLYPSALVACMYAERLEAESERARNQHRG